MMKLKMNRNITNLNSLKRKQEIDCFNLVKNAILKNNGIVLINANCEIELISKMFAEAVSNTYENDFPDFVFENGGIEHFQITSSKETKKGSEYKIKESKNNNENKKIYNDILNNYSNSLFVAFTNDVYDFFTYEDYLASLKRNIVNHVESLIKNHYQNKTVAFLIEQQTGRPYIMGTDGKAEFCLMSKDKNALAIIKENCVGVSYIIYLVSNIVELIDIRKIDELFKKSLDYKNVKVGRQINGNISFLPS